MRDENLYTFRFLLIVVRLERFNQKVIGYCKMKLLLLAFFLSFSMVFAQETTQTPPSCYEGSTQNGTGMVILKACDFRRVSST